MKRVMLVVSYDGTAYNGWQVQPNGNTIEGEINKALFDLLGAQIRVSGASRTDAGVHAKCNLAIFDTDTRIPAQKISFALNQRLPKDIRIRQSLEVPADFHPRFVKTQKTYEYHIYNDKFPNPVNRLYSHFCYYDLNLDAMRRAASYLVGEHDFEAFCSAGAQVESTVREITGIKIDATGKDNDYPRNIIIQVSGYGFLYNMVRIIAGTLLEVGRGACEPERVKKALDTRDRSIVGPTAPANGLILSEYRILEKINLQFN